MQVVQDVKLDFKDVLFRPQRSTLASRSEVDLNRTFKFKHSPQQWWGTPIIAANMDTVGTFEMYGALKNHNMVTALHKHYNVDQIVDFYSRGIDKDTIIEYELIRRGKEHYDIAVPVTVESYKDLEQCTRSFYSMGITDADFQKFVEVMTKIAVKTGIEDMDDRSNMGKYSPLHPVKMVCVDVANGYTERFVSFIEQLRQRWPHLVIMAGNVVTGDMTQALILAGADIVKVGIGPGSVCTTRKMTGVGYPQLSAIMECADAAHQLGGLICGDGGCTNPGDVAKAFGGGADFVMLGGMFSGTDESSGEIITKSFLSQELDESTGKQYVETHEYKKFYGMSSETAMNKHNGGVAKYRTSEGRTALVPYKGPVNAVIEEILGGIRSTCTYVGAKKLKELTKRTTFIRVTQQINTVFESNTIGK